MTNTPLCYIITPVGMLGYGLDEDLTALELAKTTSSGVPTALILDSGSTDSGPGKLAFGSMTCPRSAYLKDLKKLLALVHRFHVPLIFSSAGGDGTDDHVLTMGDIIEEITANENQQAYHFKTISIYSGISKQTVMSRLKEGRVTGCGPCVPPLSEEDIKSSHRIVAQVGPEPFIDVMDENPDFDVIIAGRAYDPAPYVAYSVFQLKRQFPGLGPDEIKQRMGGFLHMGKIMECGGLCSTPKSMSAASAIYEDGTFDVWPLEPTSRCTPISVAAHALYENTRPDILRGPGGCLYLDQSRYEQLEDGKTVRVSGSCFRTSKEDGKPYQWKLEAARAIGQRTMFLGTIRDEILIEQIDPMLARVKQYVKLHHLDIQEKWELEFHVYGNRLVMASVPAEIFIVAETLAPTQELATSIASKARIAMIHGSYPGQKATAGNLGFGIGGLMEIELGPCAQFSIYHLMELDVGEERLTANKAKGAADYTPLIRSKVSTIGKIIPAKPTNGQGSGGHDLVCRLSSMTIKNPHSYEKAPICIQKRPTSPKILSDVSQILRSKNAGPYEITIDILFFTREIYNRIQKSGLLSSENVSEALKIAQEHIIWAGFFEPALAFKVTIPRFRGGKMTSAGSFMEDDVHGSQQHTGIAKLRLPESYFTDSTSPLQ